MSVDEFARGCSEGQFRIVGGRREWIAPSQALYERLKLDEAADERSWRAKRKGGSSEAGVVA